MPDDALRDVLVRATDMVAVSVGRGVLASVGELITAHLGPGPSKVVADENTFAVAGEAVQESLCGFRAVVAEPLVSPGRPVLYVAQDNTDRIRDSLGDVVLVVVGAGILSDLVKLAALELGRDYACVGTAASTDNYTGPGAPMSSQGVKVTHACKALAVIVVDLDTAVAVPAYLTVSGYGGLAAKIPGGADWILVDTTGVEPIDLDVWRLVRSGVATVLSDPDALTAGQPDAFRGLVERLCPPGLAMQAYGGARPASGAEYYFSHLWELVHLGADPEVPLSHGAKAAVGSLAMCALYEVLIGRDLSGIDVDVVAARRTPRPGIEANTRNRFEGALADHVVCETRSKYLAGTESVGRLRLPVAERPEVTERLRAQLVPMGVLADRLRRADVPSRSEDIGVIREDVWALFPRTMHYRSRYMVLDIMRELGLLEGLMAEVFGKIWA